MPGEGDLSEDEFSHLLDGPQTDFPLFAPPKQPINLTEYAIGIHVARLIADGGTLQIGIGEEGRRGGARDDLAPARERGFPRGGLRVSPAVRRRLSIEERAPFDRVSTA